MHEYLGLITLMLRRVHADFLPQGNVHSSWQWTFPFFHMMLLRHDFFEKFKAVPFVLRLLFVKDENV